MEHGREVYTEEKVSFKERLVNGKDWILDHKGQVVVASLSTAALATYITYQVFEGKSYDGFEDINS